MGDSHPNASRRGLSPAHLRGQLRPDSVRRDHLLLGFAVPPELVFDQGLGDLSVARVADNGTTGTLSESLYYGRSVLGSSVLFVPGLTDCGAVKTVVTSSFPSHELESVKLLFPAVQAARHMVAQAGGNPNDPNQVIPVTTEQNVILEVQLLIK